LAVAAAIYGLWLATIYLRYHYLVDVLRPGIVRRWSRDRDASIT
jgi:hypothetical protein